jgi:hypothetical protein
VFESVGGLGASFSPIFLFRRMAAVVHGFAVAAKEQRVVMPLLDLANPKLSITFVLDRRIAAELHDSYPHLEPNPCLMQKLFHCVNSFLHLLTPECRIIAWTDSLGLLSPL